MSVQPIPQAYSARAYTLWQRFVGGPGLTVTLAYALVLAVVWPLQQARWVPGLAPLSLFATGGLAFAVVVHRDGWRSRAAHLSSIGLGLVIAVVVTTSMTTGFDAIERFVNLVKDFARWVDAIGGDQTRSGLLQFALFLVFLSWSVGFLAAWWALGKRQGWPTVVLGGLVMTIALSNTGSEPTRPLALFMGAAALLLIHLTTTRLLATWRARRLTFDPVVVLSQSAVVLVFGLVVVLAIALLPAPARAPLGSIADATRDAVEAAEAEFSRLFNGLPSRRAYRTITFEDTTRFRGNPNLTEQVLFTVEGERARYWRARTYNRYTSTGWESADAEWVDAEELESLETPHVENSHTFRVDASTDTLFSGGEFTQASIPAEALIREDEAWDPLQVRFSEGRENFQTRTDLRYESTGRTADASAHQLRNASRDYPRWISDNYTGLPGTVPRRVIDLAIRVAGRLDNAYDQAEVIRRHVLSYPYNLEIAGPPRGRDGVDYFLFDLRQGYCDYFASATAVLFRALGIPARYVLGYAPGGYDVARGEWTVRDLHYHSWVEAYFPGYGWIVFEATPPDAIEFGGAATTAALFDPEPDSDIGDIDQFLDDEEENPLLLGDFDLNTGFQFQTWMFVTLALAIGAALLGIAWHRWWWSLGSYGRAAERYAKMQRLAGLMGFPLRPSQTPNEFGAALSEEVPQVAADIATVVGAYELQRYSGRLLTMQQIDAADRAYRHLRWALVRRLLRVRPA